MGENIITPFWASDIVTREPVMLIQDGDNLQGRLLFYPDEILQIEMWSSEENIAPNSNYTIQNIRKSEHGGAIIDLVSSDLPHLSNEDLIKPLGSPDGIASTQHNTAFLIFSEKAMFHKTQVYITYRHSDSWPGYIPQCDSHTLIKTKQRIINEEKIQLLVFGDSISVGCNASKFMGIEPFVGGYPELFGDLLRQKFGSVRLHLINESVGGQSATWGAKQIKTILLQNPEFRFNLNILAWGMNDSSGKHSNRRYLHEIETQIKLILHVNPDAEFILVASSLPNPLWDHGHGEILKQYEQGLIKLAQKWKGKVAVADLTKLWEDVLIRKSYYDLTGNGVNHPNDFGHILYANVLVGLLHE